MGWKCLQCHVGIKRRVIFIHWDSYINDSDYTLAETRNKSCLDATSGNEFQRHTSFYQHLSKSLRKAIGHYEVIFTNQQGS